MNQHIRNFVSAALVGSSLLASAPSFAQVEVVVEPPPAFLATSTPVYFEGRPAYWYGGRWYYRQGRAWSYYHEEPGFLRDYRVRREPVRAYYGREHGGGYMHRR